MKPGDTDTINRNSEIKDMEFTPPFKKSLTRYWILSNELMVFFGLSSDGMADFIFTVYRCKQTQGNKISCTEEKVITNSEFDDLGSIQIGYMGGYMIVAGQKKETQFVLIHSFPIDGVEVDNALSNLPKTISNNWNTEIPIKITTMNNPKEMLIYIATEDNQILFSRIILKTDDKNNEFAYLEGVGNHNLGSQIGEEICIDDFHERRDPENERTIINVFSNCRDGLTANDPGVV